MREGEVAGEVAGDVQVDSLVLCLRHRTERHAKDLHKPNWNTDQTEQISAAYQTAETKLP